MEVKNHDLIDGEQVLWSFTPEWGYRRTYFLTDHRVIQQNLSSEIISVSWEEIEDFKIDLLLLGMGIGVIFYGQKKDRKGRSKLTKLVNIILLPFNEYERVKSIILKHLKISTARMDEKEREGEKGYARDIADMQLIIFFPMLLFFIKIIQDNLDIASWGWFLPVIVVATLVFIDFYMFLHMGTLLHPRKRIFYSLLTFCIAGATFLGVVFPTLVVINNL